MKNVQTPATKRHDPDTSLEAERAVNESGERKRQQDIVAEAVRQYPGYTSKALGRLTGIDYYTLARRLPDCETAGTVVRGTPSVPEGGGRSATTWWPPSYTEDDYRKDCLDAERIARKQLRKERREALAKVEGQRGREAAQRVRRMVEQWWREKREGAA